MAAEEVWNVRGDGGRLVTSGVVQDLLSDLREDEHPAKILTLELEGVTFQLLIPYSHAQMSSREGGT